MVIKTIGFLFQTQRVGGGVINAIILNRADLVFIEAAPPIRQRGLGPLQRRSGRIRRFFCQRPLLWFRLTLTPHKGGGLFFTKKRKKILNRRENCGSVFIFILNPRDGVRVAKIGEKMSVFDCFKLIV